MQLALIAPYCHLVFQNTQQMQMMLPMGLENDNYSSRYMTWGKDPSKYVILDNGMFEGHTIQNEHLLDLAIRYRVSEIVMPDTRGSASHSEYQQRQFFALWNGEAMNGAYDCKLMAVIQGYDDEGLKQVDSISRWAPPGRVTLGFPRRMTEQRGRTHSRIDMIEQVLHKYGRSFDLHMLGMSRTWPAELKAAARQFGPFVRSMDTSAPWVYTAAGQALSEASSPADRENNYFTAPDETYTSILHSHNLDVVMHWAEGVTPNYIWEG
jgi:hypothetical protein